MGAAALTGESAGESAHALPPPALRATRLLAGAISLLVSLSAVGLLGAAWGLGNQPYWLLTGMELTALLAGVVGVLFASGRFAEGPGMALLCVAGTVFAASVLGWLSLYRGSLLVQLELRNGGAVGLSWMFAGRVVLGLVVALLASFEVVRRNPLSRGALARAAGAGVPLAVLVAAFWFGRTWADTQTLVPAWVIWTLAALGSIAMLGLFCATVHCLIRAHELGRPEALERGRADGAGAPSA